MSFLCFNLHEKGQLRADGRHNNTVTKREVCNLIKREWWEHLASSDVFTLVMLMSSVFAYLRNCLRQYQCIAEDWKGKDGEKEVMSLNRGRRYCFMYQPTNLPSTETYSNLSIKATGQQRHEQQQRAFLALHRTKGMSCYGTLRRHSRTLALAMNMALGDTHTGHKAH